MKRISSLLLVVALFFSINSFAFAQSASPFFKDQTTTIVGSAEPIPTSPGSITPAPGGSAAIAYWADIFASHLQVGADGVHMTKLPSPLTNPSNGVTMRAGRYVCTGLAIAASRLAGEKVPAQGLVINMQYYWESVTGSALIDYTANNHLISVVRPGDFFFQLNKGDDLHGYSRHGAHVSVIYSINIDQNGDGIMVTREANAPKTSITVRFQNWEMHSYDYRGGFDTFLFGLHNKQ